jgi:Carboxypeptidase regulatory-like domain
MGAMGLRRTVATIAVFMVAVASAREKKPAPPSSSINFTVLKDYNGKPVRNAAVVLHPVEDGGKQEKGGLELKTNADGKASMDGLPYGKLRVQVLAHGLQTYGEDFDVEQPTMEITIKLKSPNGQYSIYEDHPAPDQNTDNQTKTPESKPQ